MLVVKRVIDVFTTNGVGVGVRIWLMLAFLIAEWALVIALGLIDGIICWQLNKLLNLLLLLLPEPTAGVPLLRAHRNLLVKVVMLVIQVIALWLGHTCRVLLQLQKTVIKSIIVVICHHDLLVLMSIKDALDLFNCILLLQMGQFEAFEDFLLVTF